MNKEVKIHKQIIEEMNKQGRKVYINPIVNPKPYR